MSSFVTRMKAYREKLHMTQSELADRVGVRRETILRLDKGQYNPSLKLATDISAELQAPIQEVFQFPEREAEPETCFVVFGRVAGGTDGNRREIFGICDSWHQAEEIAEEIRAQGYLPDICQTEKNQRIRL